MPFIMLLGETGTGKSTFVVRAHGRLQENHLVGESLESFTKSATEYECQHESQKTANCYLVDTPGFNNSTSENDQETLAKISKWLDTSRFQNEHIRVLFFVDIRRNHTPKSRGKVIAPVDIPRPPGVLLVTTHWTDTSQNQRKKIEAEISKHYSISTHYMAQFTGTKESAWEVIAASKRVADTVTVAKFGRALKILSGAVKKEHISVFTRIKNLFSR